MHYNSLIYKQLFDKTLERASDGENLEKNNGKEGASCIIDR